MRVLLLAVWLLFAFLAFGPASLLGPPVQDEALTSLILQLARFQGPEPWAVACFQLLGVLPLAYARILLRDGPGQPLPAAPFVIGSFALGGAALLPYLALRRPAAPVRTGPAWLLRFCTSRFVGYALAAAAVALVAWAAVTGDPARFVELVHGNRFVRTYVIDLLVLSSMYPWVRAVDERLRR